MASGRLCVFLFVWGGVSAKAVADLRGVQGTLPPGSKFFQFHAFLGKIWQNRMLAPPRGVGTPLLGEILDPPLQGVSARGISAQGSSASAPRGCLPLVPEGCLADTSPPLGQND